MTTARQRRLYETNGKMLMDVIAKHRTYYATHYGKPSNCCTSHFICLEDVENIVLQDLREITKYANERYKILHFITEKFVCF